MSAAANWARHRWLNEPATILAEGSWWSTIDEYDGNRLATQRVTLESGETATGIGAAWDWTSQRDVEVLLASLRASGTIGPTSDGPPPASGCSSTRSRWRASPGSGDDRAVTHTAEASAVSRSCLRRWVAAS